MLVSVLGVFEAVTLWKKLRKKCFIFNILTLFLVKFMRGWYERGALNVSAYRFCFEKERKSDLLLSKATVIS